jgi:pyruvate dehydrogenase E2 component (dihydrolipoyllysine-residue acetyltransferase)
MELRMTLNNNGLDVTVSSATSKLAEELGIDVRSLSSSGVEGRVLVTDVENARLEKNSSSQCSGYKRKVSVGAEDNQPIVKIRRLVARKMEEAWKSIPHFYVTIAVNMTDVVRLRHEHGSTINDFVLAATARSLGQHPWVNATWNGEQAVELDNINIAMAAATDRGLYYPVLHDCHHMNFKQLCLQSKELSAKASDNGQLSDEETAGATFTVTNMGMLGVESFGAIITPPQAAVLSVGSVKGEVIVDDQGEPAVALMMRMTLSADHRVLDGADAAEFLDTVRCYLEAPVMLVND